MTAHSPIVVKTYKGSQDKATQLFQDDVVVMSRNCYFPTTQSYAPGSYGCGTFILAILLCFVVVGFLILIYMLIVKPDGVLTVTYEYRGSQGVGDAASFVSPDAPVLNPTQSAGYRMGKRISSFFRS